MSTDNSVAHLKEIMGIFGRTLSIGGDSGPSYRAAYKRELGDMVYLWNMVASTTLHPRG